MHPFHMPMTGSTTCTSTGGGVARRQRTLVTRSLFSSTRLQFTFVSFVFVMQISFSRKCWHYCASAFSPNNSPRIVNLNHAVSFNIGRETNTYSRIRTTSPHRRNVYYFRNKQSFKTTAKTNPFRVLPLKNEQDNLVEQAEGTNDLYEVTDDSISYIHSDAVALPDNVTKIGNAVLLIVSFGWALYTILKVDEGMTRGWTQQEIMMRIPIDNWRTYEYNLHESPIETKTFINVIIYLLGDWLSQTIFQNKNALDFDASRTFKNGFIGLCFGPLVHEYYEFSDRILPLDVDINRLYKIVMDQTIYLSVKCSIYIIAVGLLSGSTLQESIDNVKSRIKNVMLTAWSFWPLVHCVTYTVIPARHRILWVNCVDLVWNAILATKARGSIPVDEPAEPIIVIESSNPDVDQRDVLLATSTELLKDQVSETPQVGTMMELTSTVPELNFTHTSEHRL